MEDSMATRSRAFAVLATAAVLSLGLASAGGCSSSRSGGYEAPGTDAGNLVACDEGGPCTQPPPSTGSPTTATTAQNFALRHVHLGDELDSAGNPDWYQYGYNLDGKATTAKSTNVCQLAASASTQNQVDGPGGVDNSFGENVIVGVLAGIVGNASDNIDTGIAAGEYGVMLDITGLVPDAAQTATGLSGMLFNAVPFAQGPNAPGSVPTFTTADNWPVDPRGLANAPASGTTISGPATSLLTFSGAYVDDGVFVSGEPTEVTLALTVKGAPLPIPIQRAVITFNHPGVDGGAQSIDHGIIAGVIDANTFVTNLAAVSGNVELSLCHASAFAAVRESILEAADIMDDGSNEPGQPCNGISIGIGFDADEIMQPTVTGTPAAGTNLCSQSETDAGSP
jgi:hypothetical protein